MQLLCPQGGSVRFVPSEMLSPRSSPRLPDSLTCRSDRPTHGAASIETTGTSADREESVNQYNNKMLLMLDATLLSEDLSRLPKLRAAGPTETSILHATHK